MRIYYSSKFKKEYQRLPKHIKRKAEEKEKMLREDYFSPGLKTHKLHGYLQGYLAFWIDEKYRIIFELADKNIIWFHSVGDHSIYKRF